MESQGTLHTNNNLPNTTQSLFSQPGVIMHDVAQNIVHDAGNTAIILEMEEEIALWVGRVITYFMVALLFYINLEFVLPLELLFLLPLLIDILLTVYYARKAVVSS